MAVCPRTRIRAANDIASGIRALGRFSVEKFMGDPPAVVGAGGRCRPPQGSSRGSRELRRGPGRSAVGATIVPFFCVNESRRAASPRALPPERRDLRTAEAPARRVLRPYSPLAELCYHFDVTRALQPNTKSTHQ